MTNTRRRSLCSCSVVTGRAGAVHYRHPDCQPERSAGSVVPVHPGIIEAVRALNQACVPVHDDLMRLVHVVNQQSAPLVEALRHTIARLGDNPGGRPGAARIPERGSPDE